MAASSRSYPRQLLPDEVGVGEPLAEDRHGGVQEPTPIGVFPVVVSERLFVKVAEKVEGLNAHVGSLDGSFQQALEVLQPVRVDFALGVGNGMVDHFVLILVTQFDVGT